MMDYLPTQLKLRTNKRLANDLFLPSLDWTELNPSDHFVKFYDDDKSLVDSVSDYLGKGLKAGDCCIVIATPEHRNGFENELRNSGIDLTFERDKGQYISLDAEYALSLFMVNGSPDAQRFMETIGGIIAPVYERGGCVRAFGEMVALLWAEGNQEGALRLEELWNNLSEKFSFSLFCAYPMAGLDSADASIPFQQICSHHTHVIPLEDYAETMKTNNPLHEITLLQQKARALESEVAHRKEVEKVLSIREKELSDFLENAIEGLHKVGCDGTILWANRAELDLLGYSPDEYIGHNISEFHADQDVISDIIEKLQSGQDLYNRPARILCKDGSIKHVLIHSNAHIEDGHFVYTRCFTRDNTANHNDELSRVRLAAIVNSSDDAIISKTLDGIITSWNKGAENIFGYTAEEAIGKPKTFIFPPDRLQEEVDILSRLVKGEAIDHFETVRVHKDGRPIDISLTISPIRDSLDTVIGASTIARDITITKRNVQELAAMNSRLERAVTETHHRVKNNLQLMSALIEMQKLT
ncbi:MAG: PAS domain S-box protein, partial [Chthonomonadales bacterium]